MTEKVAYSRGRGRKPTRAKQLGVTDDEYARLLAAQDGHCALCPNRPKTRRLHVDHDHATGRVRGLLCYACNRRLWTGCTAAWLTRAAQYVEPGATVIYFSAREKRELTEALAFGHTMGTTVREAL